MKKNNRKVRKLVNVINAKVDEATKLNKGSIVAVDIAGLGFKGRGKYYKRIKEQIIKQGAWRFYYIKGGTKLVLKAQG